MSHAQIVAALVARDAQLRYALANKRKLHQVVRRVRQKQDDQLVPVTSKACDLVADSQHMHGKWMTQRQMLAIGLRKALSNVSARSYGLTSCSDLSKNSVTKAEVFTAWQMKQCFRWWVFGRMAAMASQRDKRNVMIVSFVADATNSSIWQRRKLQPMLVDVRCCVGDSCSGSKCAADVLPVEDGTASGAEALLRKQLSGLGIPLWCDISEDDRHFHERSLWIFTSTSDCGPDQAVCRRNVAARIRPLRIICFLSMDCLCHQGHIIASGGLLMIDQLLRDSSVPWTYYSSLCKLIHLWRDMSRQIYSEWKRRYGPASAERHVARLPPKCVAARWLSVGESEKYMIELEELAPPVICAVLQGCAKGDAVQSATVDAKSELAIEDLKSYKLKLGRWRKDVLSTIVDKLFWTIAQINYSAKSPIDRFQAFCQKTIPEKDAITKGYHLRQLTCGRAKQVITDIETQLADNNKQWCTLFALHEEKQTFLVHMAASLLLLYEAAFIRRVFLLLMTYPWRMMLMLQAEPERDCATRRQIADEVLAMRSTGWPDENVHADATVLDPTTVKIAFAYEDALITSRDQGVLADDLRMLLCEIDSTTRIHVQEVESVNSLIGFLSKRARNMNLDLLSSRITTKKALGQDCLRKRWSIVKSTADALSDNMLHAIERGEAPLSTKHGPLCPLEDDNMMRWKAPMPIADKVDAASAAMVSRETMVAHGIAEPTRQSAFAVTYQLQWFRELPATLLKECIGFNILATAGSILFVCCERHRYRGTMSVWKVQDPDTKTIELQFPLDFRSSLDVFADHFPGEGMKTKVYRYRMVFDHGVMVRASLVGRGKLAFTMERKNKRAYNKGGGRDRKLGVDVASAVSRALAPDLVDDDNEELSEDVLRNMARVVEVDDNDEAGCDLEADLTRLLDEASAMEGQRIQDLIDDLRTEDSELVHTAASAADDETEAIANMVIGNIGVDAHEAELFKKVRDLWIESVEGASEAQAQATSCKPLGYDDQLSLVKEGSDAVLVKWAGEPGGMGRPVSMDRQGRAKWIIPGLVPAKNYAACEVIAPAVGMKLWRMKGRDRPSVPEATKRLIRMAHVGTYKVAAIKTCSAKRREPLGARW